MIKFIDLKAQYDSIKKDVDKAVRNVLTSGDYILGRHVAIFEAAFASYCGSRYAVGVASGTEALYLALAACGVGRADEVITAPNTTAPTAAAIFMAGAIPVYADIDGLTLTMDPSAVKSAITKRTKAIVPVHLYGNPADMDPILDIARRKRLYVIEDAAQAHGAVYKKRRAGSLGEAGIFSFYPTKNLGCYGDGGMVVTDDRALARRLRRMRAYGERKRYRYAERGINSRLDEMQAAILMAKLKYLDRWNRKRALIAAMYDDMLRGTIVEPQKVLPRCRSSRHLYVIQAPRREGLREFLSAAGIQTLVHYPDPLYRVKPYASGSGAKDFPVCEAVSKRILSLPLYPEMSLKEVHAVAGAVKDFYLVSAGRRAGLNMPCGHRKIRRINSRTPSITTSPIQKSGDRSYK